MKKFILTLAVIATLYGCEKLEVPTKDMATYETEQFRFSLFLTERGKLPDKRQVEFQSGDAVIINCWLENLTDDTLFYAPHFSDVKAISEFGAV